MSSLQDGPDGQPSREFERERRQNLLGIDAGFRARAGLQAAIDDPDGPFARGFRGGLDSNGDLLGDQVKLLFRDRLATAVKHADTAREYGYAGGYRAGYTAGHAAAVAQAKQAKRDE